MPELPEVETVRRGLAPHLVGQPIARVEVRRPDLRWKLPEDLVQVLTGATVTALERRSKYLVGPLDRGPALLLHLGMSGRFRIEGEAVGVFHHAHGMRPEHDHLVIEMADGVRLVFNDARRFGMVDLIRPGEAHPLLAKLGPEPLGEGLGLAAAFRGRRAPVKQVLMDQRRVAGLGNIYVSEALHRAGIDPRRAAGRIGAARVAALEAAIRAVLGEAIEAGGSSLRDHRQATGEPGHFQHSFRVYDREGQPCPKPGCAGTVRRVVQGGRSSFFCPRCQH